MENYIVSARKYRPDTFDTVVGQEALTTTLKNAISTNKLAHAYLFCGPRGVGKTTCARIFAKTINCLNKTTQGEACNECESCKAFNEQRSYNIHELDAASNNAVDDIRQLIDMVRVQPQIGKYGVFIIDEVHMLSTQAFNAFLKTLEEPPAHAIFILATTEKHKLLPTILSRCQIYDFNRIKVQDIVNHLSKVATSEGVEAEPEALNVIAVKSDGGLRDALSMFDQSVSFTRGHLTYAGVLENLNVLDYEYYFRLVDAFLNNSIVDALLIFNEVLSKGFEANSFVTGLSAHFRDLLVSKDEATLMLLETTATIRDRYKEQASKCDARFVFRAMKICRDCELNYRVSKNKRLLVELALVEMAQLTDDTGEAERPKGHKKLKPILKEQTASQTSHSKQAVVTVKEPQTNYQLDKKEVDKKDLNTNTQSPQEVSKGAALHTNSMIEQLKSSGGVKKKAVSIKDLGSVSIKDMQRSLGGGATEMANPVITTTISAPVKEKLQTAFTDGDLNYQWQFFVNRMPIDLKALAIRMRAMRIELLPNSVQFEVVVDNELVANEFKAIKRDLELFLRRELKNDLVEMLIRVSAPDENNRAFTKGERYQLMSEKNEVLNHLKDTFGLEFN